MTWLNSLTIRGLLITLVALTVDRLGLAESVAPEQIADTLLVLLQYGGLVVAALGRKRAQGPL